MKINGKRTDKDGDNIQLKEKINQLMKNIPFDH